ncbi:MAG: hypothetical protein SNI91_06510 [Rikenellaceae bacterium]
MGESILVIVYEKEIKNVQKSILIDCYEQNNMNRLQPILDSYNINKDKGLDYVIWTHPDQDHSGGFDLIISNYTSKKTNYLLPGSLQEDNCGSKDAITSLNLIKDQSVGLNYSVHQVSVLSIANTPMILGKSKFFDPYSDDIDFEIEILTPFSDRTFRKQFCCNNFCLNELSISVIIRFGKLNFYFGGDCENESINKVDSEKFKNIDFIKIPHHASKTSDALISKIGENYPPERRPIAVTTSFTHGRSKLPNISILNEYKTYSDQVYLTDSENRMESYGLWKFVYNIQSLQLYKPVASGDAIVYVP